ncbi:MAG TPA: hypothetical protein VMW38_11520 [Terriglobia bacterium]|nr:hypothetical protein [Terriglobia bacterium]
MNCQEFESIIRDLARDSDRSSGLWDSAGIHLEGCTQCSARLADETALESGLRQLASKARDIGAPVELEARLLIAFRRERDFRQAIRFSGWRLFGWRWALAGGILVLLTLALAWHRSPKWGLVPASPGTQHAKAVPVVPADRPEGAGGVGQMKEPARKTLLANSRVGVELRRSPPRQVTPVRKVGKTIEKQPTLKDLQAETAYFEPEVVTEFIPFMAVGEIFPEEQQQLVRVKLPRSALEAFGLPVNRERVIDPIQADMLIGEDGLVRAIRFVH